ncbi:TetR family transcriptional regulator [Streptomyces sp. NPDC024089]|uniref:TetR family transcriptional regulator n=1 Tax=Streptomyces sp. NPDC024089 TaxID=3154328 RepID=UPI0033F1ADE4
MARRTQGTSAELDRERIAAAVALVDRDGLERFGVRRLAQELKVDPMSVYHHIKGKAALLDAMSEAVLAGGHLRPGGTGHRDA